MYTFLRFCFLEKLFLGNKISKDEIESAAKVKNLSVCRKFGDFCDQLDKEELDFERRTRRISKNLSQFSFMDVLYVTRMDVLYVFYSSEGEKEERRKKMVIINRYSE